MIKSEVVVFLSRGIYYSNLLDAKVRRLERLRKTELKLEEVFLSAEIQGNIKLAENELEQCVENLLISQKKVDSAIDGIKNNTQRIILEYRYINDYTVQQIAETLHYSERHIARLHDQAVNMLTKIL